MKRIDAPAPRPRPWWLRWRPAPHPIAHQLRAMADFIERQRPETKAFAIAVVDNPDDAIWAGSLEHRTPGQTVALLSKAIALVRQ